jgi:hypothetical protein
MRASLLFFFAVVMNAGEDLIVRIADAEQWRDSQIQQVRSIRRYTLHNSHWTPDPSMDVLVTIDWTGKETYEILSTNATGLQKTIFKRILDGEVEAAAHKDSEVNPDKYEGKPLGTRIIDGRECQVVQLTPKQRTKYVVDGSACVDTKDAAIVRLEGRLAKSVSFWVGKPYIVQDFRKIGQFWYSSMNRSTADVKLLGATELTIRYIDYQITPKHGPLLMACSSGTCSPRLAQHFTPTVATP